MTAVATAPVALFGVDPATHRRHAVHVTDRTYPETNCYTDLLIELIHARGDEPLAVLGSTVRLDFEGDQWTFFKPHPGDLESLLGIDIHETQPWRALPDQLVETIAAGRTLTIEVDAWYLPDTAATSYGRERVKTTIAVDTIDPERERLVYFHNAVVAALEGADYRGLFRQDPVPSGDVLPPYVELVRFDGPTRLEGEDLRAAAAATTRRHLDLLADGNPFERFGSRLGADLEGLLAGDEAAYHAYAFATVRMAGAGFELLGAHVDWLLGAEAPPVTDALARIVEGSKLLGFKLARRRPFDPSATVADMADAWTVAMTELDRRLPRRG